MATLQLPAMPGKHSPGPLHLFARLVPLARRSGEAFAASLLRIPPRAVFRPFPRCLSPVWAGFRPLPMALDAVRATLFFFVAALLLAFAGRNRPGDVAFSGFTPVMALAAVGRFRLRASRGRRRERRGRQSDHLSGGARRRLRTAGRSVRPFGAIPEVADSPGHHFEAPGHVGQAGRVQVFDGHLHMVQPAFELFGRQGAPRREAGDDFPTRRSAPGLPFRRGRRPAQALRLAAPGRRRRLLQAAGLHSAGRRRSGLPPPAGGTRGARGTAFVRRMDAGGTHGVMHSFLEALLLLPHLAGGFVVAGGAQFLPLSVEFTDLLPKLANFRGQGTALAEEGALGPQSQGQQHQDAGNDFHGE